MWREEKNTSTPIWAFHVMAWGCYLCFTYLVNKLSKPLLGIVETIVFLLPFAAVFYLNLYLFRKTRNQGLLIQSLTFIAAMAGLGSLAYGYTYRLLPALGIVIYSNPSSKLFFQSAILGLVQYTGYALLFFFVEEKFRIEKLNNSMQKANLQLEKEKVQRELDLARLKEKELKANQEKLEYEYAFLRSQINPHFLHNTLNVLFSQASHYSSELADNILKLSTIMRYSLESLEYASGTVSIERELEQLQTLLDIHYLRFGTSKRIQYVTEGEITGQQLPPLALITIVENAFKYGDLRDPQHPLLIKVKLQPDEIYFYCRNKKKKNDIQLSSFNIGISNLTRRMETLFAGKYEMNACNEEDFYVFELTIKN